jgi:uncharacterized protein YndB with AHSA1/START domain
MTMTTIAPVVREVRVRRNTTDAFRIFTEEIGAWWPVGSHSRAADEELPMPAVSAAIEPRAGGRIYEIRADGVTADWGLVVAWEPPDRLVLAWRPNASDRPYTEVEVTFEADGDTTHVRLEHRGWEQLGELGVRAAEGYRTGWIPVLERFAAHADADTD